MIEEVKNWKASDGLIFVSEESAEIHERKIKLRDRHDDLVVKLKELFDIQKSDNKEDQDFIDKIHSEVCGLRAIEDFETFSLCIIDLYTVFPKQMLKIGEIVESIVNE